MVRCIVHAEVVHWRLEGCSVFDQRGRVDFADGLLDIFLRWRTADLEKPLGGRRNGIYTVRALCEARAIYRIYRRRVFFFKLATLAGESASKSILVAGVAGDFEMCGVASFGTLDHI